MELIVTRDEANQPIVRPRRIVSLNENYQIWYYDDDDLPPISVGGYSYSSIPKCMGLLGTESLDKSGILKLQREFVPGLLGEGVLVAVIDTGINYDLPVFMDDSGQSRVFALWDQEESLYLDRGQIEESLDRPLSRDTTGHGTMISSIIAGRESRENNFTGVVPAAQLVVVKLKKASKQLKDYFFIPEREEVYAQTDIMLAVKYAHDIAQQENKPLAICLALGCNNGSHNGTEIINEYLYSVAVERGRALVVGCGNEGNNRHHYKGSGNSDIEVNVEKDMRGFYVEFWALAPNLYDIRVQSPSGQTVGGQGNWSFVLEGTRVELTYRFTGRYSRDLLIFIHFTDVVRGIWTIKVNSMYALTEDYDLWLPMEGMLEGNVTFIASNPDTTLTSPSDGISTIAVGGYNSANDAFYLESGRGFDTDSRVNPNFVAPAVNVSGVNRLGDFTEFTGSSIAAAITTGAAAQFLEWAIVRQNAPGINTVDIKNAFIRGARRRNDEQYPQKTVGYGYLDAFETFFR